MILTSGARQKIILTSAHNSDNTLPDSHPLNLRTLTHTHTSDDTSDDTLPDSAPPRNKSTKSANPHPYTCEVRTPIAKAIWEKKKKQTHIESTDLDGNVSRLIICPKSRLNYRLGAPQPLSSHLGFYTLKQ